MKNYPACKELRRTCVKRPLSKRPQIGFQDQLLLNAGQGEHSAIILTFIKLPFVIKSYELWPFFDLGLG